MSLEERVRQSQRRGSAVEIMDNPLSKGGSSTVKKMETVVDTRPINKMEVIGLIEKYIGFDDDNKRILEELEVDKQPFNFECDDLLILMGCTTSVRTKLAMVIAIAPRLIDPKSKMDLIVASFRFAEEKETAEDAIKARIQVLTGSIFKKKLMNNARGGRGSASLAGGGRGSGSAKMRTNTNSASSSSLQSQDREKDSDDEEDEDDIEGAVPFQKPEVLSSSGDRNIVGDSDDVDEISNDTVVDVHEIYGSSKPDAEEPSAAVIEEEVYEDEMDSDDDLPPPAAAVPSKPQDSLASSVFKAFSYGFGGSK